MIDILHLHGFKCAGTTFSASLQRNYGDGVAYVESEARGDRLPWQFVDVSIDLRPLRALSSHLITLPPSEQGFARMHVAFVRDPRARLRSAYAFQSRTGSLPQANMSFGDYLTHVRHTALANYQTRHLSPQDFGGWRQRRGWQLRPELIDLARKDLFVGVVERFDESMVVLESRLRGMGIDFDGSYSDRLNAHSGKTTDTPDPIPLDVVELDETLHARVSEHLDACIRTIPDFDARLGEFHARCREQSMMGASMHVPGPADWTYLDASKWIESARAEATPRLGGQA
jgi:hypothetical protein